MGATVAEIRAGLAANLAAITGVQISAYMLDRPEPPTIQIIGPATTYDLALGRGLDEWMIVVQGMVGAIADIGSAVVLDRWVESSGATSVKAAIEADKTLGGKVQDVRVMSQDPYQRFQIPDRGEVLGCEWQVQVFNRGK